MFWGKEGCIEKIKRKWELVKREWVEGSRVGQFKVCKINTFFSCSKGWQKGNKFSKLLITLISCFEIVVLGGGSSGH